MKDLFTLMPDFLRDPDGFFESIRDGKEVRDKAIKLALISISLRFEFLDTFVIRLSK